ncbi:hypothetical protein Lal_00017702 [Lupinus albus]|nr:hypothetical protein Lal_00017702 [Lupinus albus]
MLILPHLEPLKYVIRVRYLNLFEEQPLLNDQFKLIDFSKLSSLQYFNIDSSLITSPVERWRLEAHTFHLPCVCAEQLGKVSIDEQDMMGCELKVTWLVDNFARLSSCPTKLQIEQYCRARILYIIGGNLLPDKSNNRKDVSGNQTKCKSHEWVFATSTILDMISPTFSGT